MKRAVAIIHRAVDTVGLEFHNASGIRRDGDANVVNVRLSLSCTKAVAILVLDLAGVRVSTKVGLAVELEGALPAVALNGELAAIAGVVASRVVVGVTVAVDGVAGVVDNSEAVEVVVQSAAGWPGDGGEATRGPNNPEVLGVGGRSQSHKAKEGVVDGRHDYDL